MTHFCLCFKNLIITASMLSIVACNEVTTTGQATRNDARKAILSDGITSEGVVIEVVSGSNLAKGLYLSRSSDTYEICDSDPGQGAELIVPHVNQRKNMEYVFPIGPAPQPRNVVVRLRINGVQISEWGVVR